MNARQAKKRYMYRMARNEIYYKENMRVHKRTDITFAWQLLHSNRRGWWLRRYGLQYIKKMREMKMKMWIHGKYVA